MLIPYCEPILLVLVGLMEGRQYKADILQMDYKIILYKVKLRIAVFGFLLHSMLQHTTTQVCSLLNAKS